MSILIKSSIPEGSVGSDCSMPLTQNDRRRIIPIKMYDFEFAPHETLWSDAHPIFNLLECFLRKLFLYMLGAICNRSVELGVRKRRELRQV